MGTCPSSTAPLDSSAPSAATLIAAGAKNVGDTVAIGCGSAGTVANHVTCPNGFQNVGETQTCHYCSGNNGTASTSSAGAYSKGGVPIVGRRLQCKLVQYLGDGNDCCRTGASGGGSCDPTYLDFTKGSCDSSMQSWCPTNLTNSRCQTFINQRNGTDAVNSIMKGYCSQGDRIFSDSVCKAWAASTSNGGNNGTAADGMKQTYCGTNLTSQYCLDYCTSQTGVATNQKNWCDTKWKAYAAANPTAPLSSCLLPLNDTNYPLYSTYLKMNQTTGTTPDPRCFSSACVLSGYKQGSAANCPQCVQSQVLTIGSGVSDVKLQDIIQSCGGATANTAPQQKPVTNTGGVTSAAAASNGAVVVTTTSNDATKSPTANATTTNSTTYLSSVYAKYLSNWKYDAIALVCCCCCCLLLLAIIVLSLRGSSRTA